MTRPRGASRIVHGTAYVFATRTQRRDTHTAGRSAFHEWNNRYTIQWLSAAAAAAAAIAAARCRFPVGGERERYVTTREINDGEVSGPANSQKMRRPLPGLLSLLFSHPFFLSRAIDVFARAPPVEIESRAKGSTKKDPAIPSTA